MDTKRKYKHHWQKCMELLENGKITEEQYDEMRAKHERELEKKRKYMKGESIKNFDELFKVLEEDGLVYLYGRPMTAGFVFSQQLFGLMHAISGGRIYKVIKKEQ